MFNSDQESNNVSNNVSLESTKCLRRKSSFTTVKNILLSKIHHENLKDEDGRNESINKIAFFVKKRSSIIPTYCILYILVIIFWSCICSWAVTVLQETAQRNEGGRSDLWIGYLEGANVRVIGSLFIFSLVFRFNQCYSRWWQGRLVWGGIIENSLSFSEKASLWVVDRAYSDRLNRLIIAFPYACKAQLRGLSLTDQSESGADMVKRGLLTDDELRFLAENPCWEPEFFLDLLRATVTKVFLDEYDKGGILVLPKSNKIHEKLFSPMDKSINDLGKNIGEAISVRSAGMPKLYDDAHYIFFWIYFALAPVAWAAVMGWMTPIIVGFTALISLTLIEMGTSLVDPFGTDIVDLPIDRFCLTIEEQVREIQARSKSGKMLNFAEFSTPEKQLRRTSSIGSNLRCAVSFDDAV